MIFFLRRLLHVQRDVNGIVRDVAEYAAVIEDDARRIRHAVRNLAGALRLSEAVDALLDGDGDNDIREETREWLLRKT